MRKATNRPIVSFALALIVLAAALLRLHAGYTANGAANASEDVFLPVVQQPAYPDPFFKRIYGVLQPNTQYLATDWQSGQRARTLELGWDYYEPEDGVWSDAYVQSRKAEYQQMLDAGYLVVLDFGLQYPPAWAREIRPWKDQYNNVYDGQVNAVWSRAVREKIERYIARVFHDFGTKFYSVRLGSGGFVETLYPDSAPGFKFSYWAFDDDAMTSNPVPGWRPGQPSPNGEAERFYTWYLQGLIDTVNWQQSVVRKLFGGYLLQLMPGQGLRPSQWQGLITSNLLPENLNIYAAERGAAWNRIMDGMRDRSNVIIVCSSLGDSSATTPYLDELSSDPVRWSSAHWVGYNADRYHFPKWGENVGRNDHVNMQVVFAQIDQFDYQGLFWAFEPDLYDGQYASIDHYANMISLHP